MLTEFRTLPIADWRILYRKMDLAIKGGINRLEQVLISGFILAGYDRGNGKVDEVSSWLAGNFSWIPSSARNRYAKLFGEEVIHFLAGVEYPEDMGELITGDIYSAEIDYLISEDYVVFAEDILWRHHQLGWSLSAGEQIAIYRYLNKTWIDKESDR